MQAPIISNSICSLPQDQHFPRQIQKSNIFQSKKICHNPIFNKLNKIFLEPKHKLQPQVDKFSFVQLVQSVKIGNLAQIDTSRDNKFIKKDHLITAETQHSCVFLPVNPSSTFSKTNNHQFYANTLENKENCPLQVQNVQSQFLIDKTDEFSNKINKIKGKKNDKEINNNRKSTNNLVFGQNHEGKYFYENHKLKKIQKPQITALNTYQQPHQQNQFQMNFTNPHSVPFELQAQLSSIHAQPQQSSIKKPHTIQPSSVKRIQQLQQKIEYYQKMQQFYLDQIQSYREDKNMLQWKLKLIVQELIFLTMKDKLVGSSGMKGSCSMSFVKQSKELLMSKVHELNLSIKLSELIVENKVNLSIADNLQLNSHHFCIQDLKKLHSQLSPSQPKQPRQSFDLQPSSQYIQSFILENVTMVESEGQDEGQESQKRILRQKIIQFPMNLSIGEPQFLSFV